MLVKDINGNIKDIKSFNPRTHKYDANADTIVELSPHEREAFNLTDVEMVNKTLRTKFIDAYRKYQAAVNYGEFQRVPAVDCFIQRLRNKDWSAFGSIPAAIKYFAGECTFAQSGLIENAI